ncbi:MULTISPECIES: hypothetical protein [Meiothermus]|uniref:Uncharacterized protein n=2 Tax=Meiothermus hypogaeus TaxID=884155 RepID=A0A511R6L6_9DEIN|nr:MULTISPECIES: hypothetical protein [Meiothermus]RIH74802.1 hypothetical protein Mhypo_03185 [Meiothermus hypogaeus]GEM84877.1 hypothetical protein MHY01S_30430 [Meiothermus hypogaeus NBRC 106114]
MSEITQEKDKSLGLFVAGLKTSKDKVKDRQAFVARSQAKYSAPLVGGFQMLGLGGSCGKPAFLLPFATRWTLEKVEALEAVAERFGMTMEYGAYPHLKLPDGTEIAAVHDWLHETHVYLRPSYERKEELIQAIAEAIKPAG